MNWNQIKKVFGEFKESLVVVATAICTISLIPFFLAYLLIFKSKRLFWDYRGLAWFHRWHILWTEMMIEKEQLVIIQ